MALKRSVKDLNSLWIKHASYTPYLRALWLGLSQKLIRISSFPIISKFLQTSLPQYIRQSQILVHNKYLHKIHNYKESANLGILAPNSPILNWTKGEDMVFTWFSSIQNFVRSKFKWIDASSYLSYPVCASGHPYFEPFVILGSSLSYSSITHIVTNTYFPNKSSNAISYII